jgi:hypothetical protein
VRCRGMRTHAPAALLLHVHYAAPPGHHPPPHVPAPERGVSLLLRVVRLLRVRCVPAAARAGRRAGPARARAPGRALRPRHHDARNRL